MSFQLEKNTDHNAVLDQSFTEHPDFSAVRPAGEERNAAICSKSKQDDVAILD